MVEGNGKSPANTQCMSSKVSKILKDAIDSINIMNMKGSPSIYGLFEIINSKLTLEASHDSEGFKTAHDKIGYEITRTEDEWVEPEEVFADTYGSSVNQVTNLLSAEEARGDIRNLKEEPRSRRSSNGGVSSLNEEKSQSSGGKVNSKD